MKKDPPSAVEVMNIGWQTGMQSGLRSLPDLASAELWSLGFRSYFKLGQGGLQRTKDDIGYVGSATSLVIARGLDQTSQ